MHPSRTKVALVAYSSTSDVSGTYRTWILGSRAWISMYVARHQKEQEFGPVRTDPRQKIHRDEQQTVSDFSAVWHYVGFVIRCYTIKFTCTFKEFF